MKINSLIALTCLILNVAPLYAAPVDSSSASESHQVLKPHLTGKTMAQISASLGQPQQKYDAVGQPPITRWQYSDQTVYFEADRAIHSVKHR